MIQGFCHCGAVRWRFDGVPGGVFAVNRRKRRVLQSAHLARSSRLPLASALEMIANGTIQDGKTIMLLQYAALAGLEAWRAAR